MPKQRDRFLFRFAEGTVKLAGKVSEVQTSISTCNLPDQGKEHHDDLQGGADGFNPAEQQSTDDVEVRKSFFLVDVGITFVVVTFDQEFR